MTGPRKSTAPYTGPPAWLDARHELPLPRKSGYDRARFVLECMAALLSLGLTPQQSAEVTANACGEAAWGESLWHGNPYGWKITRAHALAWRAKHGPDGPAWWRARGNVDSGDQDWCFYRAFPSLVESLGEWVKHFVPKPGEPAPYPGYRATGAAFWAGGGGWFSELILAGYKGSRTNARLTKLREKGRPDAEHPSVRDHRSIVRSVLRLWAQHRLGVDVDGRWGPASRAACRAVQRGAGLPETGELDDATLAALAPGGGM